MSGPERASARAGACAACRVPGGLCRLVTGVSEMDGELLSATFVELTDTLVAGFDVIDFLHVLTDRSVQLLDVSAAGLLLADPRGELRVVAASSEAARLLELFQLQSDQGPCLDCFRSGRPVAAADLAAEAARGRGSCRPPGR